MKFESNEDLIFEDRLVLVYNEIINRYPTMDKEIAKKAASICNVITDKTVTDNDKFSRFYYLIKFNLDNPNILKSLIADLSIIKYENLSDKYKSIYSRMIEFFDKGYVEFPNISDY